MVKTTCMDGNTAAVGMAYAMSDVAVIYPITPSSPMGQLADEWANKDKKNIFDRTVSVRQLQSEGGVSGALHGATIMGSLTSTYTAAQGLLLMIPEMYKIAGELHPTVFHVATRALASTAMSIYSDFGDVMACRQTGFCMLNSNTVQEVADFACCSHIASIKSSLPYLHFFDGMRISHEIETIEYPEMEDIKKIYDYEALSRWRARNVASNIKPYSIGGLWNQDYHWQMFETYTPYHEKAPKILQEVFDSYAKLTGRQYKLFDYFGSEDAEFLTISMGHGVNPLEETMHRLIAKGAKIGLVKVRLFKPFDLDAFISSLPKTVKKICVLDHTQEVTASGDPLYLAVVSALSASMMIDIDVVAGCYGIAGKEFDASQANAVWKNLMKEKSVDKFTVGIIDDVNKNSLVVDEEIDVIPEGFTQAMLYGMGSDGTVSANKAAIKIIGEKTDLFAQGYFAYDSKKSGGYTISHLRFGPKEIHSSYEIQQADYVGCHQPMYVHNFDLIDRMKKGSILAMNTPWSTVEEVEKGLPKKMQKKMGEKEIKFFVVDARKLAIEHKLRGAINMIMQSVFFKLISVIPLEQALKELKGAVEQQYSKKGADIVEHNISAIDEALEGLKEIKYDHNKWAAIPDGELEDPLVTGDEYVDKIHLPTLARKSETIPVSDLIALESGYVPLNSSKWEKRGVADRIPDWNKDKCIQCNLCSLSCPHAVIRPFITDEESEKVKPEGFETIPLKGSKDKSLRFRIQVSPFDCVSCGSCINVCPKDALTWTDAHEVEKKKEIAKLWDFAEKIPMHKYYPSVEGKKPTVKSTQFHTPMIEFSAACAGCAEVPYLKLLTQLYGEDLVTANACGCSMVWGGMYTTVPWTTDHEGRGPCYAGTLFEDAGEFGYGLALASNLRRKLLRADIGKILDKSQDKDPQLTDELEKALKSWLDNCDDKAKTIETSSEVIRLLPQVDGKSSTLMKRIKESTDVLRKKIVWVFGGDGWAYDIGYGGLDHVMSLDVDLNILIMDTEVYSNTGGQQSKATPRGAIAGFCAKGHTTRKKDFGLLAMNSGNAYVASIAMGANQTQTLNAFREAVDFDGPSIVIAYCPCLAHQIREGLGTSQLEQKYAVQSGYWQLYRFDPMKKTGRFSMDSKKLTMDIDEFIGKERRFTSLMEQFPDVAKELLGMLKEDIVYRHKTLEAFRKSVEEEEKSQK